MQLTITMVQQFVIDLPYVFLLEDMSSFLTNNNLSSEDAKKCPNVLLFDIMNSKNISMSHRRSQERGLGGPVPLFKVHI